MQEMFRTLHVIMKEVLTTLWKKKKKKLHVKKKKRKKKERKEKRTLHKQKASVNWPVYLTSSVNAGQQWGAERSTLHWGIHLSICQFQFNETCDWGMVGTRPQLYPAISYCLRCGGSGADSGPRWKPCHHTSGGRSHIHGHEWNSVTVLHWYGGD